MRAFTLLLALVLTYTTAVAGTFQIGAFKHKGVPEIERAFKKITRAGYKLKIYQKDGLKKVIAEIPDDKVSQFEKEFGLKTVHVDENRLRKEGFQLMAVIAPKKNNRIPLSKVINSLLSIKLSKEAVFIYGKMPWEYVDTQKLENPDRVVVRLFNAKNLSGITDMLVTPIPGISKIKVVYNPKDIETDVVLYPEGKVEVEVIRLGRTLKVIPKVVTAQKTAVEVGENQMVTLEFKDADIRDVINILSEVSGINFVIDPEVKGTVTIKLKNVPWRKALDVILKVNGLGMIDEGYNIVRIGPIDKINRELEKRARMQKVIEEVAPVYTRIFELDYAKASELKKLVENMLTPGKGKGKVEKGVDVIDRLNALLVRGTKEELKRIEAFIKKADVPIPQVQISARIVEVSSTKIKDLGIRWGFTFNQEATPYNFPHSYDTSANIDLGFNPSVGTTPATTIAAALLNRSSTFRLNFEITALEESGLARIISNPKVITMDNREAEISQGYEIPYSTYSDQGTNVEFKEAKLKLKVTPHITSKGDILLDIEVDKDSPDFTHTTPDGVPIQTRSVKTRVRLQSGETLVVGGIYEMTEQNGKRGVPYLNRVPIIKWLFGKEYRNVDKKELLIFITPTIVKYNNGQENQK